MIKAAGGIRDQESAYKYIRGGVTRIGTSSGIDLVRGEKRSTMNTYWITTRLYSTDTNYQFNFKS